MFLHFLVSRINPELDSGSINAELVTVFFNESFNLWKDIVEYVLVTQLIFHLV